MCVRACGCVVRACVCACELRRLCECEVFVFQPRVSVSPCFVRRSMNSNVFDIPIGFCVNIYVFHAFVGLNGQAL